MYNTDKLIEIGTPKINGGKLDSMLESTDIEMVTLAVSIIIRHGREYCERYFNTINREGISWYGTTIILDEKQCLAVEIVPFSIKYAKYLIPKNEVRTKIWRKYDNPKVIKI